MQGRRLFPAVGADVARPAVALSLLFAWLLALPLAGPILYRASPPGLGPLRAGEAFALAHALGLLGLGLWAAWRPLPPALSWLGAGAGALGLAMAATPASLWPPMLAAAGALSAGGVLAVGVAIARLPWGARPWAIAAGALVANLPLYLLSYPGLSLPARPLAAVLALGPLLLPVALPRQADPSLGRPPWRDLSALAPAVFACYLVGGLMYSLVLPTLGGLGLRIGVGPYMAMLAPAAYLATRLGRGWAARPGVGLLGLGFAAWALMGAGARDIPAQALIVGGYAFLDVSFWAAFADRSGRPGASLGLGLGAMVLAIFAGMALSRPLATAVQGREEDVALVAAMALLVAAVLMPLLPYDRPARGPAPSPAARAFALGLSQRELEVAALAARGLSNKEIARALRLSPGTVRKHLERAYRKLGVRGRAQVAALLRLEADGPGDAAAHGQDAARQGAREDGPGPPAGA